MQYIRTIRAPFALLALSATVACAGGDANDDALATDTAALNRDINLAGTDTAAQPALTDVPAATSPAPAASRPTTSSNTPRPSTTTSRPSTSTSRPSTSGSSSGSSSSGSTASSGAGALNAGYTINARANEKICTNTQKVGDTFTATVYETVSGTGTAQIPDGATVTLRITRAERGENVNDDPVLTAVVQSMTINGRTYSPEATVTYAKVDKERASTRGNDAKKVIGGAVIGAVAGQVLGKDTRSTVTGAAAGAAAGAGAAVATANFNGCIASGSRIQVRIDESVQLRS